jgi:hypothetical protein
MPDTFPLLLKEGWPDHFLIMIQMLIPAGVVDCYDIHHVDFHQAQLQTTLYTHLRSYSRRFLILSLFYPHRPKGGLKKIDSFLRSAFKLLNLLYYESY